MLTYCSSDYEIGGTFQMLEEIKIHDDGDGMMMIKCSGLEKKKEKNKMGSRQR